QGDVRFADVLAKRGADVRFGGDFIEARAGAPLCGGTIDCTAIPDAAMTLAVTALFATGPTRLENIGSWSVKETDRIAAMAAELRHEAASVGVPLVIAVDGPAASGKGTIAAGVARELGFRYLDSGSLYRLVALKALRAGIPLTDEPALAAAASDLDFAFGNGGVQLDREDATEGIRSEAVSAAASQVAVHPAVRRALLSRQRAFRQPPGLVADGRDMGTVVFPDAAIKVFVTASAEERAKRRYKQLIAKGMSITIEGLL